MSEFPENLLEDQDNDSPLIADLRRQLRDKDKELKKANERIAQTEKERRADLIKAALKTRKLPEKLLKLVPGDVEIDALETWLDEYQDAFVGEGVTAPTADQTVPSATSEQVAAIQQAQLTEASGEPPENLGASGFQKLLDEAGATNSIDELTDYLRARGLAR